MGGTQAEDLVYALRWGGGLGMEEKGSMIARHETYGSGSHNWVRSRERYIYSNDMESISIPWPWSLFTSALQYI